MKTSIRFENAVRKLYDAFHSNTLNPLCCKQCAVGNILDNRDFWKDLSTAHGSTELSYAGKINEFLGKKFAGFSPSELLQIERTFLKSCGVDLPIRSSQRKNNFSKDKLFDGLVATVELLCRLDNIPNILDCSKLFEFNSENYKIPETVE